MTKTQMADDVPRATKVTLLPRTGMSLSTAMPKSKVKGPVAPMPKSKPKGSMGQMLDRRQHEQQVCDEALPVKAKNRPGKKERERKRKQMSSDGSEGSWTPVSFASASKRPCSSSGPRPWELSQIGSMLPKTAKTPGFKVKREFTYDPKSGNVCHFAESFDTR